MFGKLWSLRVSSAGHLQVLLLLTTIWDNCPIRENVRMLIRLIGLPKMVPLKLNFLFLFLFAKPTAMEFGSRIFKEQARAFMTLFSAWRQRQWRKALRLLQENSNMQFTSHCWYILARFGCRSKDQNHAAGCSFLCGVCAGTVAFSS